MGILMGKQLAAENAKKEDQQKKRDAELRAKIRENLNVDTDSAGIVESLYKRIPTNARLLLENLAGVDTPITAEDFTKDELVEMVFLAEKQREVNAEREKFFREQQQFDVHPEQKAKTKKRLQSFENTRGRTSVDPYKSVGNEPIVSGRKVDKGYLDSVISSFTDPRYGIATTLGKYTALDENNKISRIKDTYNFNKKQRKLPTDFIGAVKQIMISPELAGEYIANTLGTQDREVDIKLPRKMKEGGMAKRVAKQMELFGPAERGFDDGGLMDEGGTVDPISGNDVPPGSNQEEVRDDIPAQLSEGEFVFPADVVRYFGLEKLMEMRQEAKMGLQRMEDMGQMGNSEEAIMPDNLPFDIEDLDMEDDQLEMAQGGVVQAANGTFVQPTPTTPNAGVFYNPAAQSTTGVAAAPMQAASASAAPSIGQAATPVQAGSGKPTMFTNYQLPQAPVPVMTAPDQLPKFLGEVTPGVGGVDYTEETYVNEAGQTVTFRRYNDGSLKDLSGNEAVIPEGYTIKTEAEKDVGTGPVKVETTTGETQDSFGDNQDTKESSASVTLGGTSGKGEQKGLRVGDYKTFGVSYNIPGTFGALSMLGTSVGLAFGKGLPENATADIFDQDFPNVSLTVPAADFNAMKAAGYKGELADMYKNALSTTANVVNNKAVNIAAPIGIQTGRMLDANGKPIGDKTQGLVERAVVRSVLSNVKTQSPGLIGQINNFNKVSFQEAIKDINDAEKAVLDNMGVDLDDSFSVGKSDVAGDSRDDPVQEAVQAQARADQAKADAVAVKAETDSYVDSSTSSDSDFNGFSEGTAPSGDAEDEGDFAMSKGGLAKQMKRSGLASKK